MPEILLDRRDGVATITLNRPDKLNAFAGTMREQLLDALHAANDDETRAVVITGAGRAFCSGGDIETMVQLRREGDVEGFRKLLAAGAAIVTRIRSFRVPVIASVNGVAAGAGCNLALACDYRIGASSARFGQSFARIGLVPDWGGTWLLPRLIGESRAIELMTSGRLVNAAEALELGMLDKVVPDESLSAETDSLAATIAQGAPLAIDAIKTLVRASAANDLESQLAREADAQVEMFTSTDAGEGLAAFLEKRRARFSGR